MDSFLKLITYCMEQRVSDIHITPDHPVILRRDDKVFPQAELVWNSREVDDLADKLMESHHKRLLKYRWSVDFSRRLGNHNLRINAVATYRGLTLNIRLLPGTIPRLEHLNLHPSLQDILNRKSGLVLFCGAVGNGKTTTIASFLNEINRTRNKHIVTLEDPIEYLFQSHKSFVEQRERGTHFKSFEQGLVDSLRQTPDVIMVGELREREIIRQTLNIAEAGVLVFGTMHAGSAEEALYRIINSFPLETQEMVRTQLSATIVAIVVQQLVYREDVGFRVPLLSILRGTQAVRNTLRDNKLALIESVLEMGSDEHMYTFSRYEKEFLSRKDNFVPPSVSFKPASGPRLMSPNKSRLVDYSTLEEAPPKERVVVTQSGAPLTGMDQFQARPAGAASGPVFSKDSTSEEMERYIKQLERGEA